jgi:malonyl-CoA O-methyltransferase
VAERQGAPQFQTEIARYKRRENLDLVAAWAPARVARVLKTDLFEEAYGEDELMQALAVTYPTVAGMDLSGVVAAAARRRMPGAPLAIGDACALPFKRCSFDLIVSISTLDHLPPPLLPAGLRELCRVLAPGGCLILTLDSRHNPLHVFSNALRRRLGRIHAERCYSLGDVRRALAGQRVTVTDETAVYHVPFPFNAVAKEAERRLGDPANRAIRVAVRAFAALGRLPTRFLTGRYIAMRIVKPA